MVSREPGRDDTESLNPGDQGACHDKNVGVDCLDGESKSPRTGGGFGYMDILFSIVFAMVGGLCGIELLRGITRGLLSPLIFNSVLDHPCDKIVSIVCPMTLEGCKGKSTFRVFYVTG
jgi:hypothetical protein